MARHDLMTPTPDLSMNLQCSTLYFHDIGNPNLWRVRFAACSAFHPPLNLSDGHTARQVIGPDFTMMPASAPEMEAVSGDVGESGHRTYWASGLLRF